MAAEKVKFVKSNQAVEQVEEAEPVEVPKKVVKQPEYQLVEVPTGKALAYSTPSGEIVTTEELLVQIANDLDLIKRGIIGA